MHNCKEARLKFKKCTHESDISEKHYIINCTEIFDTDRKGIALCLDCYT